jgi:hypothetical protein
MSTADSGQKHLISDYHPSFQQIALIDLEMGEHDESRMNHRDGEAERFYWELKQRGVSLRVGL